MVLAVEVDELAVEVEVEEEEEEEEEEGVVVEDEAGLKATSARPKRDATASSSNASSSNLPPFAPGETPEAPRPTFLDGGYKEKPMNRSHPQNDIEIFIFGYLLLRIYINIFNNDIYMR